ISKDFNYQVVNVHEKTINIADQVRSVPENAEIGASVGAVIPVTGDAVITGYSIVSGDNEGIFSIDGNGQITINDNSKLDYETTLPYSIVVKVSGEDAVDKMATITININNIPENVIVIGNQSMEVLKGSDIDVAVGTVVLSGGRVNAWSIADGLYSKYYKIDNNGVISVKAKLADSVVIHSITVQAGGEDAFMTTATITIKVSANAHPPKINNTNVQIDEGTVQVLTIVASDADLVDKTQVLRYRISSTDGNVFELDNTNHTVSFVNAPDYETKDSYNLTLKVSDGMSESQKDITVTINNIHEETINIGTQVRAIDENSVSGANIGDKLITTGAVKGFSIIGGNSANLFRIDSSGQMKVSNTGLDYESTTTYALTVKITGEDADDKTAVINVNVNNVNEKTITINNQSRSVVENSIINTHVGDKIVTTGIVANFEIIEGNTNGMFTVDNTGQIKVAKSGLDYDVLNTYSLKVKITGEDADEKIATVTVNINNISENVIGLNANQVFYIPQGSENGFSIGTIKTSATINAVNGFTITNGDANDLFFVASNGLIFLSGDAPTTAKDYNLQIEIKADDALPVIGSIEIKVNNNIPIIGIDANQTRSIAENAAVGANVGAVLTTTGNPTTFEIVNGNTNNVFDINTSGQITVAKALNFETTENYTLTVKISKPNVADKQTTVAITINNINENTLALNNQNMRVLKGSAINATVGTVALSSGSSAVSTWAITGGANKDNYKIDNNGTIKVKTALANTVATHTITVQASGTDADPVTATITIQVIANPNPAVINNTDVVRDEGTSLTALTIDASDIGGTTLTYSIGGTDAGLFDINGTVVTFKTAPDFDAPADNGTNNVYNLTLKVNDTLSTTEKPITITITNVNEAILVINNQTLQVDENSIVDAIVGTVATTGTPTAFSITAGNTDNFFKINPTTGQIQVATTGLDHESKTSHTLEVTISKTDADNKKATITITINNLADTPIEQTPTVNAGADITTSIGKTVTLTATGNDPDGDNNALTYAWTQTDSTGISVALTNANTANASFTTTRAMEGKDFIFSVTVTDGTYNATDSLIVTINNAKVVAQAVRKESKAAAKVLLARVSKTVMSRLSYLRNKQNKTSNFNVSGFVNGVQISFANAELNTAFNAVLGANGVNTTLPTATKKINHWDTWTSAKVVIGESKGEGNNKTKFTLKSINVGIDRRIDRNKTLGFSLGLGKQDRTAKGTDFTGDVDTTQWTLSSYGAVELNKHTAIESVFGIAKGKHKVSNTDTASDNQDSNGYFASIAYRGEMTKEQYGLSPFIRYDLSRIKMKATDVLSNSNIATDEAIALGIDANSTLAYKNGELNRFMHLEYKSDIRRDGSDYISKNAEQEIILKFGVDYQEKDITFSINYERVQATNNKAHSDGVEGSIRWKF
ncbi:MAG: autotransporter domain-containing protein, partial [Gammaproteobacteria bacterium]|nr:autotransporter domain-containing protein [Gammaproteobacteria bacterium]